MVEARSCKTQSKKKKTEVSKETEMFIKACNQGKKNEKSTKITKDSESSVEILNNYGTVYNFTSLVTLNSIESLAQTLITDVFNIEEKEFSDTS